MASNTVILDFETYRWEGELFEELVEEKKAAVSPPKSLKKKESIEKWKKEELDGAKEKAAEEFRAKAALDPLTGRLLAASLAVEKFEPAGSETLDDRWDFHFFLAREDQAEFKLIHDVDAILAEAKPKKLVTFSGRDFDIPFYTGRAIINDIPLQFTMPSYKYDRMHFDMRDALPNGPLDYWFRAALGEKKKGSGKMVDGWVKEGNWDALEAYCQDIRLAATLWERVRNVVHVT